MSTEDPKTDIWMPIVIGDYLKDTQALDATRHGCYLLWLMHYWTQGPLPNSLDDLVMIGKLRGSDATSIAQALLEKFFKLEGDGLWHQKRADQERQRWQGKKQKAKDKAVLAAKIRWENHAPSNAQSNAQAMLGPMLGPCPSPSPSPSPNNKSKNRELSLLSPEATPEGLKPSDFAETWNRLCGNLPKIQAFSNSRQKFVRARINQGITLERFEQAVIACTVKGWLRGANPRGWVATFDWLVSNDRNIERVITEPWAGVGSTPQKADPLAGMTFTNARAQ